MQVKRYVAADMRRALELVRNDLGSEAIILSNRRVKQGVEILTTIEGGFEQKGEPEQQAESTSEWEETLMDSDAVMSIAQNPPADRWSHSQRSLQLPQSSQLNQPGSDSAGSVHTKTVPPFSQENTKPQENDAIPSLSLNAGNMPAHLKHEIARAREKMLDALSEDSRTGNTTNGNEQASKQHNSMQHNNSTQHTNATSLNRSSDTPSFKTDQVADSNTANQQTSFLPQMGSALKDLIKSSDDQATQRPVTHSASHTQPMVDSISAEQNENNSQRELADVKAELKTMRSMLQDQIGSIAWGQFSCHNPTQAALWQRFHNMGLSAAITHELIKDVGSQESVQRAWPQALHALAHRLDILDCDLVKDGGVFAFVGPTGVGKTTTIGKLAARYVLKHGSESAALVTTDNYRIAAHEQLKAFSKILDIPIRVAHKPSELPVILEEFADKSLVLIDTAGLTIQDPQLTEQLDVLSGLQNQLKTLLVLSATSQKQVMHTAVKCYERAGLHSCVLTKLDEVTSLGESFSVIIEDNLSLAYYTDGQTIPDDLYRAKPKKLVNKAITLARMYKVEPDSIAESFQSVMNKANNSARALFS